MSWRAENAPHAPSDLPSPRPPLYLDWSWDLQQFREHLADRYVRIMTEAIREKDTSHLLTMGLHQKSAPFDWYPPDPYAAFNPHRLAPMLDYISVHYYPHHIFHPNIYRDPFDTEEGMTETLLHGRAVSRYVHVPGKPVVMEECGWYGGGPVSFADREQRSLTEAQQAQWCTRLVEATKGDVSGWLFWPYRDTPSSLDPSRRSGLFDEAGRLKDWGRAFKRLSPEITGSPRQRQPGTVRMPVCPARSCHRPAEDQVIPRRLPRGVQGREGRRLPAAVGRMGPCPGSCGRTGRTGARCAGRPCRTRRSRTRAFPPGLRLSGNHRLSIDPDAFEKRMHSITNADLWSALVPGAAASADDWQALLRVKPGPVRLSSWAGLPDRPFITMDEYRAEARARPGMQEDIVRQADLVAAHELGYGTFTHRFGPTVDFNHEFGYAGMKYGWHYWQWGIPLAGAYALTGDGEYAAAFAELFAQWFEQRDSVADTLANLDADVIWHELGIALRVPVFVDACRLMAGSSAWPAAVSADLLRTIVGHCRWLYECSTRNPFHAYNWPIQAAVTLGYAGTALPELAEAASWRAQADAVIAEHLRRDFQADGGYQERTPNYTRYVLETLWIYARLLETQEPAAVEAGRSRGVRGRIRGATESCLSVWAGVMTPLGLAPAVNDTRRSTEMALFLTTGSRRFGRPDFLGPASLARVHTAPTRVGAHAFLDAVPEPARGAAASFPPFLSAWYPSTGFAVMRTDWTGRARYFFLNFTPWAVHAHEDVLSFECYADGAALAVDPGLAAAGYGTEEYASWYQAARGHNMLCVEEADPARHLVDIADARWQSGPMLDFAAATHSGYVEPFGVRHRRHVAFVKPHFWIVWDRVWAERPGLTLDWYFHSPLPLQPAADGWTSSGGPGVSLLAADAGRFERGSGQGPADTEGLPGEPAHRMVDWVSFRWKTAAGGPQDIAVLIAPGKESAAIRQVAAGQLDVTVGSLSYRVTMRSAGAEAVER